MSTTNSGDLVADSHANDVVDSLDHENSVEHLDTRKGGAWEGLEHPPAF